MHRGRAGAGTHLAVRSMALLIALVAAFGCDHPAPGSVSMRFTWDVPPQRAVWIWARVEERRDPTEPGPILASVGPERYVAGDRLALSMKGVAHGDDRVVVVEVREGSSPGLRVLYYGLSAPFALAAEHDVDVAVPLVLQAPQSEWREPSVDLLFEGEPRASVGADAVRAATIRTRSSGAVAVVFANDASFSAGLQTFALDPADGSCQPEDDPGGGEPLLVCDHEGWDLTAGLPATPDGVYTLYARFVDIYGYESAVYRASVVLDTAGPLVLGATLSPAAARIGDTVFLTVHVHEPVDESEGASSVRLLPESASAPVFTGPSRVRDSTSYVWSADVTGDGAEDSYEIEIRLRDTLGNGSEPFALVDREGDPLVLTVDAVRPRVEEVSLDTDPSVVDAAGEPLLVLRDGATLRATFEVFEAGGLAEEPVVALAAPRPIPLERVGAEPPAAGHATYTFHLEVDAAEHREVEGAWPVSVDVRDRAGNATHIDGLSDGALVSLDFTAPSADCRLAAGSVRAGDPILLVATLSEPIAATGLALESDLALVPDELLSDPAAQPPRYVYQRTVPLGTPDMTWSYTLRGEDRAGNSPPDGVLCSGTGRVDGTPIGITASSLSATYTPPDRPGEAWDTGTFVRDGSELTIIFGVDELPVAAPEVRIGSLLLEGGVRYDRRYTFTYRVAPGAPEFPAGSLPVAVSLRDAAGNATYQTLGAFELDMTPPDIGGLPYFDREDGDPRARSAPNVVWATPSTRVHVSFPLSEPVREAPTVHLSTGDYPVDDWTIEATYVTATVVAGAAPGENVPVASLLDRAGNEADVDLGTIHVDVTPPQGLTEGDQGGVRLFRAPWGCEETDGATLTELRACPPPESGASAWDWCEGVTTGAFEDAVRVTVWRTTTSEDGTGLSCTEDVIAEGDVAEDGGALVSLPGDWPAVCVTATDRAGNVSPSRLVQAVEWVATLGRKVSGSVVENPHVFRTVPSFAADRLVFDEFGREADATDLVALGRVDGTGTTASAARLWRQRGVAAGTLPEGGGFALGFDPERGRLVLFGGTLGDQYYSDDVWEWDGEDWELVVPRGGGPTDRYGAQFVHDSARGRLVLLGGYLYQEDCTDGSRNCDDVWEWDGERWTERAYEGPRPPALPGTAATYDSRRRRLVRFGGTYAWDRPNDVWEWDGSVWYGPLSTESGPSGRDWAGLVYDEARGVTVLFGGRENSETEVVCEDESLDTHVGVCFPPGTWVWDGTRWDRVDVDGVEPPPRHGHGVAYERARERVVVFGGTVTVRNMNCPANTTVIGSDRCGYDDLWEWDGTSWTAVPRTEPWPPAGRATAAYDSVRGWTITVHENGDAWAWDGTRWRDLRPTTDAPVSRLGHAAVYDPDRGEVLLFGGSRPSGQDCGLGVPTCRDTWGWDGRDWRQRDLALTAPSGRLDHAMTWVPEGHGVLLFGGRSGTSVIDEPLADLWEWNGTAWSAVAAEGPPPPARAGARMTVDEGRGRVVLFGGDPYLERADEPAGTCTDVWEWDGVRWHDVTPARDRPPPLHRLAGAWDDVHGEVVLFGGNSRCGLVSDTWTWDGASWTRHDSTGDAPAAREWHAMAWEPAGRVAVLFGGEAPYRVGDAWDWDGHVWHEREQIETSWPGSRSGHALAYDMARGRLVMFGGVVANVGLANDTWEWDGERWEERAPEGDRPLARENHGMAYDAARGEVVLFGGTVGAAVDDDCGAGDGLCRDTWTWDGTSWSLRTDDVPAPVDGFAMAYDAAREVIVLFGAYRDDPETALTWEWDGGSWQARSPVGPSPPAREEHVLVYDAARGVTVLYGGRRHGGHGECDAGSTYCWEPWAWDGVAWRRLEGPPPVPQRRPNPGLVYDRALGQVVLAGGGDGGVHQTYSDTYLWDGTSWRDVTPAAPRPANRMSLVYDDGRARGVDFGIDPSSAVWEWDGAGWRKVPDAGSYPRVRERYATAYDGARERVVLFGGDARETWEWDAGSDVRPAALLRLDWSRAEAPVETVTGVAVTAWAGGRGYTLDRDPSDDGDVVGEPVDGVELLGWDAASGRWSVLGSNGDPRDDLASVRFEAPDEASARRLFRVRDRTLDLALRPSAAGGNGPEEASVTVDAIEARVRYRWPPETDGREGGE